MDLEVVGDNVMEELNEVETLVNDSLVSFNARKETKRTIRGIIKDTVEKTKIDRKVLKRVVGYSYYAGEEKKDAILKVANKLIEIVNDLRMTGMTELLEPLMETLLKNDIKLEVGKDEPEEGVKEEVQDLIRRIDGAYNDVENLNTDLHDVKAQKAENLAFAPKSKFINIVSLIDKIDNGKDVDDTLQNGFTQVQLLNNALTYVSNQNNEK
ncbi:MAG: hypothetical protein J6Y78_08995 [Paludibacteraceae bacterium]|nr:hypothetical protein [Paludibacteraceae bacterium]